ncbi:hypothetical protein L1987_59484 [Smallanthus sonchifolius]|uniref:Uncharacterized protein n=1 Tax=Smallanthus sonchifolius TaxID=185202 RepID=A0ACB9D629_9ASTR|nr:hypothetical protein L1987_59484 [Smallanthus sonchifolius]
MAKPPVSVHNTASDHLQTWILKVYIHCEGCKKKVFKVLQSIDGVYKTVIDAKQHKVTVTGSVNGEFIVQKLLKSGKHAEILPESFIATAAADNASGNSKKKKKKNSNKQNDGVAKADDAEHVNDEIDESKGATTDGGDVGNVQEIADPAVAGGGVDGNENGGGGGGGGKKKKNKKRKGEKNDNNAQPNGDTEGLPTDNPPAETGVTAEDVGASMKQLNLSHPVPQMVYSTPYDLPSYHNYYPTPAYGVSYSTSYPSAESSYYTPPVYGYAQSHPSVFYPPPQPPSNYRGSAFDDHDDEGGEGRGCTIL